MTDRNQVYRAHADKRAIDEVKLERDQLRREVSAFRQQAEDYRRTVGQLHDELRRWQRQVLEQGDVIDSLREEIAGFPPAAIPEEGPKMSKWKTRMKWLLLAALWTAFFTVVGPPLISARSFVEPAIALVLFLVLAMTSVAVIEAHIDSKRKEK